MVELTVRDLIKAFELRVLGGESGLDRSISSCHDCPLSFNGCIWCRNLFGAGSVRIKQTVLTPPK